MFFHFISFIHRLNFPLESGEGRRRKKNSFLRYLSLCLFHCFTEIYIYKWMKWLLMFNVCSSVNNEKGRLARWCLHGRFVSQLFASTSDDESFVHFYLSPFPLLFPLLLPFTITENSCFLLNDYFFSLSLSLSSIFYCKVKSLRLTFFHVLSNVQNSCCQWSLINYWIVSWLILLIYLVK